MFFHDFFFAAALSCKASKSRKLFSEGFSASLRDEKLFSTLSNFSQLSRGKVFQQNPTHQHETGHSGAPWVCQCDFVHFALSLFRVKREGNKRCTQSQIWVVLAAFSSIAREMLMVMKWRHSESRIFSVFFWLGVASVLQFYFSRFCRCQILFNSQIHPLHNPISCSPSSPHFRLLYIWNYDYMSEREWICARKNGNIKVLRLLSPIY